MKVIKKHTIAEEVKGNRGDGIRKNIPVRNAKVPDNWYDRSGPEEKAKENRERAAVALSITERCRGNESSCRERYQQNAYYYDGTNRSARFESDSERDNGGVTCQLGNNCNSKPRWPKQAAPRAPQY
jgi:hypothetical protein